MRMGRALLAFVAVATAACGTRLSDERIVADARTEVVGSEVAAGAGSGSGTSGGTATGAGSVATAGTGTGAIGGTGSSGTGSAGAGAGAPASDGSTPGSTPGVDAATAPVCTGDEQPIVIGSVGQQSGVAGAAVAGGPRAVAAWAAMHNANGGLNCHQIRYVVLDDGGDPSRNQALTQQLVEQEGAIAILHADAPLSMQGSRAYLESNRIPVIGSEGAFDFFYEIPTFFPQVPHGLPLGVITAAGIASAITPEQRAAVGFLGCIEQATCQAVQRAAAAEGLTIVYNGQASLTSLDFTSQCNAAKQAGALVFSLGMDPNSIVRIAASCRSVNYFPLYVTSATVLSPSLAENPNLDGMIIPTQTRPWMLGDDPAVARFHAALAEFAPGIVPSASGMSGWTSATLFERAAVALGDVPTSEDLLTGLYAVQGDDLDGLTGPLTFNAGRPATPVICWYMVQITGGAFVSPDGGNRQCR